MNKFYLVLFVLCIFNNHSILCMEENAQSQDAPKSFPLPNGSKFYLHNPQFQLLTSPNEKIIIENHKKLLENNEKLQKDIDRLSKKPSLADRLSRSSEEVVVQVFSQVLAQLLMKGIVKGIKAGMTYFQRGNADPDENPEIILHQLGLETALLQREELKQKVLMNQQNLVNQGTEKEIEKLKYLIEEYKRLEKETYDLAKKKELQEKQQDALDKIDKLSLNRTVNKSMQFAANPILAH